MASALLQACLRACGFALSTPALAVSLRWLAFHLSGRFLLMVTAGPSVTVWDIETWTVTREFDWQTGNLRSVGVSRNGLLAAVGSDTGTVTIWDRER
jgi:WD40 repeat protein